MRRWLGRALVVSAMLLTGNMLRAQSDGCDDLAGADAGRQVRIVESNASCSPAFVSLLLANPQNHLKSFYALVASPSATDALFIAVYEKLRLGQFLFRTPILDELSVGLPQAAAACKAGFRCPDWQRFVVTALESGGLFQCPSTPSLDRRGLLEIVPYAGYECVEAISSALIPFADAAVVSSLVDISTRHHVTWSRRNGMRLLGRLIEYSLTHPKWTAIGESAKNDIKTAAAGRLQNESEPVVMHEAVWILDSMFFPSFAAQLKLESVVGNSNYDASLRFRAMAAAGRLILAKRSDLDPHDVDFISASLKSDETWIRAQAAYICEAAAPRLNPQLIAALNTAWVEENQFTAKVHIGRALDRLEGASSRMTSLRRTYEDANLPNSYTEGAVMLRSSLANSELVRLAARVNRNSGLFLQMMGSQFSEALEGDSNPSLNLMIFGSNDTYREYMNAFVGSGWDTGGIYVEGTGTLYTYQRNASESVYSLEHLIDHEQAHYLQGRYIYPGAWGDADYHAQPKGWADEGLAEFIAEGGWSSASTTGSRQAQRLATICSRQQFRSLPSLLQQREGYDAAGIFDYDNAWTLLHYLLNRQPKAALNLYASMRNGTYRFEDFAAVFSAGSLDEIETGWHNAMRGWC